MIFIPNSFNPLPIPEVKNISKNYKVTDIFERLKGDKIKVGINDVSFEVKEGEVFSIIGLNGAGKTTIINLILKFYNPTSGNIYLNSKNYKTLEANFIRNNIALVFQESELFSSTVRENVAYGNINATDKQILDALKAANALDFVSKLSPGGGTGAH